MKGEEREGRKESWRENGDGKYRMIARQQEGPVEDSGLAFEARAVSVVLLSKAVFSSAGVVTELGRARFSKVGLCRKYIKRGERGLGTEGVPKGWTMVLTWILALKVVDLRFSAGNEL